MASKLRSKIKKMWLKALRSGEYEQGQGMLYTQVGPENQERELFCCLGVLCNLYAKNKKLPWRFEHCYNPNLNTLESFFMPSYQSYREVVFTYLGSDVSLPREVIKWAFSKYDLDDDAEGTLTAMNDLWSKSFKQIANWIDKNL